MPDGRHTKQVSDDQRQIRGTAYHRPVMRGPGHGRGPRGRFMGPVEKPKNLGKTLIRIIGYLRQDVLPLLLVIIAILVNTACTLAGPLVIGDTIDRYIIPGDFNGLIWASVMLLAIYGISSLSAFVQGFTMASVSEKTVARMRTDLFAKYQVLSLKFFDNHTHGELMSRLTNDIDTVSAVLHMGLTRLFSGIITISGTISLCLSKARF